MISDTTNPDGSDDLLLRVSAPRVPRHLVSRPRLLAGDAAFRDVPAVLIQAPAGFGKTSLLAQWRLEHLSRGVVVAWVSLQARDTPQRLAQALALAVRRAAGRSAFGHVLLDATGPGGLEAITIWLAELAQTALDVVLMVDEAERLPAASREALAYLLRNAPLNLRTVIASRPDSSLDIDDLIAYGQCVVIGPEMLRFRLEETIELVQGRFGPGPGVDNDTAARLHALTEGWPLGLQLSLTVMARSADARADLASMSAPGGQLRDRFLAMLLANLEAPDREFLTRIAILDHLHPALCRKVAGMDDAAERLARLSRDTPVFVAAEQGDWLRMHALARDELREDFAALAPQVQAGAHALASDWLAGRGMLEDAARHALIAGQRERAYELAERSLYESIMTHGRQGVVLEWLAQLPPDELDRRPRLLLAAAWTLATSERHEDASRLVDRILAQPQEPDATLRCECALILSGAAVFADDPDRFAALHDPWAEAPPLHDPLLLRVHANRTAYRTLLQGDPALARLRQQQSPSPRGESGRRQGFIDRWGEFIIGLSYVWEGQVLLIESLLPPALASAEANLGRRNSFVCMLAALLAAAQWERGKPSDAAALLADRLDVLERSGLPETLLLAYRTMARMAMAEGAEHRAMELLGALDAVGSARALPRLRIASLAEQVRLHARRYRAQSCRDLCQRIDSLMTDPTLPQGPLWHRSVDGLVGLAHGYCAIAAQDWRAALEPLAKAAELMQAVQQGRLQIEILGLRAFALDRCGEKATPMLREAIDLARSFGLVRIFEDAHPDLGEWARQVAGEDAGRAAGAAPAAAPESPAPAGEPHKLPAARSMVLTPKERQVVELLARNLSNKEVGRAMQVGETTVKWHVKNLLAKLDAGTRKEVVARARILGLIQPADQG